MRLKSCPEAEAASSAVEWRQFTLASATVDAPNSLCTITDEDATGTSLSVTATAQHDMSAGHPDVYSVPIADIIDATHDIEDVAAIILRIRVVSGFGNSSKPVAYLYLTEDVTTSPPNWAGAGVRWDSISGWKMHTGGVNGSTTSLGITADDIVATAVLSRDASGANIVVPAMAASAAAISGDARDAQSQSKSSVVTTSAGWLPTDTYALCVAIGAASSTGGAKTGKILFEYSILEGGRA